MRLARLALVGLLTAGSLSLAVPAQAAVGTASPDTVGNDGTKTIVIAASAFFPASQEKVVLRPVPVIEGQADLTATVSNKSACSPSAVVPNADCGNELSLSVNTTNALPGSYDVVETQTDRATVPATERTRILATVRVYSQPTFASLAPSTRGQGGTSSVTVTGTGFAGGIVADFGVGTTTGNIQVTSPTQLVVDVTVAGDALPGTRDVTLTSADARSATAPGVFTVAPGPVVTEVTPARMLRGTSGTVTVKGSRFVAGDGFAVTVNGAAVTNVVVSSDGTQITADVAVPAETPYGLRAVRVRNPDAGSFALANSFAVLAPPGAPSAVRVTTGDGTAVMTWTAPTDPGSSPITGYSVATSDPSVPVQSVTGTTAGFIGLANGNAYTFTVTPRNSDASDGASATGTGTPRYTMSLRLVARPTAIAGQNLVVTGALTRTRTGTPAAGAPVTLRFAPRLGAAFTRSVVTNSDGRFSYTLKAVYTIKVTATYAGRTEDGMATSLTPTTVVAPRVAVVSPSSGAVSAASQTITVIGSVSPNKAGRFIGLYSGASLVGKATVASNGSFRIPTRLPRGNYRVAVRIASSPGNGPGQSPYFILSRR